MYRASEIVYSKNDDEEEKKKERNNLNQRYVNGSWKKKKAYYFSDRLFTNVHDGTTTRRQIYIRYYVYERVQKASVCGDARIIEREMWRVTNDRVFWVK